MNKFLKLIVLILITTSFNNTSFSKENFFNEALELFKKEKYEDARFYLREILFLIQKTQTHIYI